MKKYLFLVALVASANLFAQPSPFLRSELVSFSDYAYLAEDVKEIRKNRLVNLKTFNTYAAQPNTVILDTRSDEMYNAKHIKGAIHLNFSDFNEANLRKLIPDRTTRILIYCNNNFMQDIQLSMEDAYFPSKISRSDVYFELPDSMLLPNPEIQQFEINPNTRSRSGYRSEPVENNKPVQPARTTPEIRQYTLALNIPTFITLFGYGYNNVYELGELINTSDPNILFEGTSVPTDENKLKEQLALELARQTTAEQPLIPSVLVNFDDYSELMNEVEPYREAHLVSMDQFNELKSQDNTIILDFRSKAQYDAKHIKGSIHLDFTDFTQQRLDELIPDRNTTILIYCNNNFVKELETLTMDPPMQTKGLSYPTSNLLRYKRTMALNIPAYINLYGYGFKNVYELGELVLVTDERVEFEGTAVSK